MNFSVSVLIAIILAVVLFSVFMILHCRHKSPAKAAVMNMLLGVLSLAVSAPLFGAAVNVYTVFTALTLGVPGTVLVAVMQTVF
jgi:hypothetical protein